MKTTLKEEPMRQKHILETIVDRLVTELNTYFTEVGKKQVKSKLPNLKLSVKTLIGNVLISEKKSVDRDTHQSISVLTGIAIPPVTRQNTLTASL